MPPNKNTIISRLAKMAELLGAAVLLLMVLHIVADVTSKYLFNYPLPGTLYIVAHYYMVACVFMPIAMVEQTRGNISVDLFYRMVPRPAQVALTVLGTIATLTFFALLGYRSVFDALKAMAKGEYIDGTIILQIWPSRFVLPICFALAILTLLTRLYGEVRYGETEAQSPNDTPNEV